MRKLGRPRHRGKDNIQTDFSRTRMGTYTGLIWLRTAASFSLLWARQWSENVAYLLKSWGNISFSRKIPLHVFS